MFVVHRNRKFNCGKTNSQEQNNISEKKTGKNARLLNINNVFWFLKGKLKRLLGIFVRDDSQNSANFLKVCNMVNRPSCLNVEPFEWIVTQ